MEVNLSKAVRSNLLSLQSTAESMAKTQERLATGLKVNSALDNPTNFFTASSLNSRAGDMASLLDSMSNGIKTIEAADNGLKAITKTVESMQSTLRQARQDKSFKTGSYAINVGSSPAGTEAISLSGGAVGSTAVSINLTTTSGGTTTPASNAVVTGTSALGAIDTGGTSATNAVLTGTTALGAIDASGGDITFDINGTTVTLSTTGGTSSDGNYSAQDIVDEINAASVTDITASLDTNGNLVLTSAGTAGASDTITVDNFSSGDVSQLGFAAGTSAGASGTDGIAAADITFDVNGETVTLSTTGGTSSDGNYSAQDIVDAINDQVGTSAGVVASLDTSGNLVVTSSGTAGATDSVTIDNFSAGDATQLGFAGASATDTGSDAATTGATTAAKTVDALVTEINANTSLNTAIRASNDNGKLRIENLSTSDLSVAGISTSGEATGAANTVTVGGNEVRKNLAKQFNELRDQLDKLADDASFNGINLLRGDKLKLTFNETGTSTLDIQAKDSDGAATSINNGSLGITSAADADLDSDTSIDAKLSTLGDALGTLRSQSSAFGSNLSIVQNRTDFTKNMINTLETGAANLTLADTNEEAANLLALQTRQQLSSTALSMASQSDQAVLRLF